MSTVIYCGPSISRQKLSRITDAEIAPPVRRGDLAAASGHDTCVILDGEFSQNLSVSPKEILRVLDSGKTVIGASSMGALRAAELKSHGMIGIGWIYQRFAAAAVRREDDVALTYSPLDFAPNSVPMVNVEYWLELLYESGQISQRERSVAAFAARRIFFADRTEKRLLSVLAQKLGNEKLTAMLQATLGEIPDIKAADAELAVRFAAGLQAATELPHEDLVPQVKTEKEPYGY